MPRLPDGAAAAAGPSMDLELSVSPSSGGGDASLRRTRTAMSQHDPSPVVRHTPSAKSQYDASPSEVAAAAPAPSRRLTANRSAKSQHDPSAPANRRVQGVGGRQRADTDNDVALPPLSGQPRRSHGRTSAGRVEETTLEGCCCGFKEEYDGLEREEGVHILSGADACCRAGGSRCGSCCCWETWQDDKLIERQLSTGASDMYRPQISKWQSRESLRRQRAELVTVRDLVYHGSLHQIHRLIDQVRNSENEDSQDGVRFECKLLNTLLRRKIPTLIEVEQQLEDPLVSARSDYNRPEYLLPDDSEVPRRAVHFIPQTNGNLEAMVAEAKLVRASAAGFTPLVWLPSLEIGWAL